jgi:catechol 2,3-dioxygenase-like lactoylglutathione lyase family enzyme
MGMHLHHVTFDCADARALAAFWSTLTGWHVWNDHDQGRSKPRQLMPSE